MSDSESNDSRSRHWSGSEDNRPSSPDGSHRSRSPTPAPDGNNIEISCSTSHEKLTEFFDKEELSDVTLVVDGEQFKCHKLLLASWSSYFESMFLGNFAEKQKSQVELKAVSPLGFRTFLDCVYRRKINLDDESVIVVFQTAHFLNVQPLLEECVYYMKNHPQIQYLKLALDYHNKELQQEMKYFVRTKFFPQATEDSMKCFAELPRDEIMSICGTIDMNTRSEYQVFEVVEQWIKGNDCSTDEKLELLKLVRVYLLSSEEWVKMLQSDLANNEKEIMKYFNNRMTYYVDQTSRPLKTDGILNCPRNTPEVVFIGGARRLNRNDSRSGSESDDDDTDKIPGTNNYYDETNLTGSCLRMGKQVRITQDNLDRLPTLPIDLSMAQAVEVNNFLYVLGGLLHGGRASFKVFRFCPVENKWLEMEPMQNARVWFTAAATSTAIYVFGGYYTKKKMTHSKIRAVEKYDIQTGHWSKIVDMDLPESVRAASLHDKVYLFFNKSIHGFTESTGNYAALVKTKQGSNKSTLLSSKAHLYVVHVDFVERFDPYTNTLDVVMENDEYYDTMTGGCAHYTTDTTKNEFKLDAFFMQRKHTISDKIIVDNYEEGVEEFRHEGNAEYFQYAFSAMASLTLRKIGD